MLWGSVVAGEMLLGVLGVVIIGSFLGNLAGAGTDCAGAGLGGARSGRGAGQDYCDEACGGGQNARAAAFGAVEGGSEGFPPGVHDGDGADDEVLVGVACCAPGPVSPGLLGVPRQVCAGGCVHAG